MRIGQTSIVHFVSRATSTVVGFLATLAIARLLGADTLGIYTLAINVVIWLQMFGDMGIQEALTKRLSEAREDDAYLLGGALIQLILFALVALVVLGLGGIVGRLTDAPLARVLSQYGLAVVGLFFVGSVYLFLLAVLRGQHRVHLASVLGPIERTARSALQIGVVLLGFGFVGLLVGYAVARAVASTVAGLLVSGHLSHPHRPALPERRHIGHLMSYSRYSWLSGLTGRAFNAMDVVVLGLFVASEFIGYYTAAWNIASMLAVFGISISEALFPEMSRLSSATDSEQVVGLLDDALAYAGLFVVPGLVGAVLLGGRVLAIYGEEFATAHLVLVVLVAARLLYAYGGQFVNTLNAIDRPELAFRVNGVFVVTNIVLNVVLVARYGWVGAAVATAVSAFVLLILGYRTLNRVVAVTVPSHEIAKQWVAAGVMGTVVVTSRVVIGGSLPATLVLVGIGAVTYFVVLSSTSERFRTTVAENLPFAPIGNR